MSTEISIEAGKLKFLAKAFNVMLENITGSDSILELCEQCFNFVSLVENEAEKIAELAE